MLKRFRGLLYAVAKRERIDTGVVSRVFHGLVTSARIRAAIEREISKRLEQEKAA